MTAEIRSAALRLEMAEGRVNAISSGRSESPAALDEAMFDRDAQRSGFHVAVQEATGMDPKTLARLLAI